MITRRPKTFRRNALFMCFLLGMWMSMTFTTHAQTCGSITIQNDSSAVLDETKICEAAAPWADKGAALFLYVTDDRFSSEKDWQKRKDAIETAWGIYKPQSDEFLKNALAIELSTDTASFTTQNVAIGEMWFDNLLKKKESLKGVLRNGLRSGDISQAITSTLNESYAINFPPPVPVEQKNVTVDTKPLAEGAATAGKVILASFILSFLIFFGFIPGIRLVARRFRLFRHIDRIRGLVSELLNEANGVLGSSSPDGTVLYQLWESYGGKNDSARDKTLRRYFKNGQQALSDSLKVWQKIGDEKPRWKSSEEEIKKYIQDLETVYITVVGSSPTVLKMTDDEQKRLFDPYSGFELHAEEEIQEDGTVSRIRTLLRQHQGEGDLQVELLEVKPGKHTTEGILGHILNIKHELDAMKKALKETEDLMKKISEAAKAARTCRMPQGFTEELLNKPILQIRSTVNGSYEAKQWHEARDKAKTVLFMLGQIPETLGQFDKAWKAIEAADTEEKTLKEELFPGKTDITEPLKKAYDECVKNFPDIPVEESKTQILKIGQLATSLKERVQAFSVACAKKTDTEAYIKTLVGKGYYDQHFVTDIQNLASITEKVYSAFFEGSYIALGGLITSLAVATEGAQKRAETLANMREKNEARLTDLSKKVANTEAVRSKTLTHWETLRTYPKENWSDVATYFDEATQTLAELFDDPTNEKDLASTIECKNGMKEQNFSEAEAMLDTAYAKAEQVKEKLSIIERRATLVLDLQRSLTGNREQVEKELTRLKSARDLHNAFIDPTVDEHITLSDKNLQRVQKLIDADLLMPADLLLQETRRMIQGALDCAHNEVSMITKLFQELDGTFSDMQAQEKTIKSGYDALPDTAKSRRTGELMSAALSAVDAAVVSKRNLDKKEDRALQKELRSVIKNGLAALDAIRLAEDAIQNDEDSYNTHFSETKNAIEEAAQAIRKARNKVNDSDADDAGKTLLRQAVALANISIVYGESTDSLSRKRSEANDAKDQAHRAQRDAEEAIEEAETEREEARQREEERNSYSGYDDDDSGFGGFGGGFGGSGGGFGSSAGSGGSSFGSSMGSFGGSFGSSAGR